MTFDAVVADANVLLSAIVGRAALRVFTQFGLEIHVSGFNAAEVEEYLPRMADKYGLPAELVRLQWRLLPFTRHGVSRYARYLSKAREDLRNRDLEDAHALALARALDLPLWSNDHDFERLGVSVITTARLLKILEKERAKT
jgi:predicted nucleic acid-binding protein